MRKIKVIDISGFRGLLIIIYAVVCIAAGFVLFPAWALMSLWNLMGTYVYNLPHMNLVHGFMLYAIFVLLYLVTNSNKPLLRLTSEKISKAQISAIMKDFEDKK